MTPEEFRAELARLGLTQAGAGKALDVDDRTIRRWLNEEDPQTIPRAVALLLPKLTPREARRLASAGSSDPSRP